MVFCSTMNRIFWYGSYAGFLNGAGFIQGSNARARSSFNFFHSLSSKSSGLSFEKVQFSMAAAWEAVGFLIFISRDIFDFF